MRATLRSEISDLEQAILSELGSGYTEKLFGSPKQKARLLYDDWELPHKKGPKGRSCDLEALSWSLDHFRRKDEPYRERVHNLFHRSRLQTILNRYLVVEGDPDGRVRPTIKLTIETGRCAYAGGPGEAVQQWPPEVRGLIRAKPGYVFVGRDYSQLEARILAVLSGDEVSLSAFQGGRDVHEQNCRDLFGFSENSYLELDSLRKMALRNYAKTFLYGLSYGGKADSIKMKLFCPCYRCTEKAPPQVNLSRDEVKRSASRWEQAHSPVMEWRAKLVDSVYGVGANRVYKSPFGWNRRFWEPQGEGERSLMNFPMQHCASQIINKVMVKAHDRGIPLTLQMHDELVMEVPADSADFYNASLKQLMEEPVPELSNMIFPTSGHIGETWADLK